jgi:hypothetical protein
MAWRTVPNSEIDTESPVTVQLMTALRDNPGAISEGATGAPKMATKNQFGNGTTGNIDFTGQDDFGGARFFMRIENSGASTRTVQANASDGTFGTAQTIYSSQPNSVEYLHGYWNKITGTITGVNTTTATLTVTGSGVTTFRVTGATDLSIGIHLMPDGGESLT